MPLDIRIAVVTLVAAAWICSSAQGQTDYGDLGGFVTMVGGSQEVSRIEAEAVSTIPAAFSYGQNRIEPGEGVRTGDDATVGAAASWLSDSLRPIVSGGASTATGGR